MNSPLLSQKTCADLVLPGKEIRQVTPSIGRAANYVVRAGYAKLLLVTEILENKLFLTVFEFLLLLALENGETLRSRRQYWNFGMF